MSDRQRVTHAGLLAGVLVALAVIGVGVLAFLRMDFRGRPRDGRPRSRRVGRRSIRP